MTNGIAVIDVVDDGVHPSSGCGGFAGSAIVGGVLVALAVLFLLGRRR